MTEHEALGQAPMCCIKAWRVIVGTLLLHYPSIAMAERSHARSRRREARRGMLPHHCARRSYANTTSYRTRVV